MISDRNNCFFPDPSRHSLYGLSSSNSKSSSFCETAELINEQSDNSKDEIFPLIQSKFINNSKALEINVSNNENFNNRKDNNKGVIGSTKKRDKSVADEDPLSRIYIRNKNDQKIYLLEFHATNAKLLPIYLKHRTFEENINDKCSQPYSMSKYVNYYNNKSIKFNQLHKSYKLFPAMGSDAVSIMSNKKPLFPKPVISSPVPNKMPSISRSENNLKKSIIFIRYKNMYFEIYPGIMILSLSELIDVEGDRRRKELLRELHMKQPVDLKNKAKIIVKHKGDILKFIFTLSEVCYTKVKVMKSVGVLALDNQVYSKTFSTVTDRPVYISVPKSVYNYRDPLIDIKRDNMSMKLLNITPYWKEEQRVKRIKEYNQCRKKSVYADLMDLRIGSKICYEGFQCLNKAKGGTYACTIDDEEYEDWVISNQRTERIIIEDEDAEKFTATFSGDVPDWDLVIYTK